MPKLKLLIADDNERIRTGMQEYFSKIPRIDLVGVASNGSDALALTLQHRPDVVILDIVMPQSDGFGYLERLAEHKHINPYVIVLTALARDELITRAIELGACFYMIKPVDLDILYRRVMSYHALSQDDAVTPADAGESAEATPPMQTLPVEAPAASIDNAIEHYLLAIGLPPHVQGYAYVREAARQVVKDETLAGRITKELYPSVAQLFATSPSKVERSIRHAIEVAWSRQSTESINAVLGRNVFSSWGRPSNGEFIACVASLVPRKLL